MPRKPKELKKIRDKRIKWRLCYDCGKELPKGYYYKRTRCKKCFQKERVREKGRIRLERNTNQLKYLKDKLIRKRDKIDNAITAIKIIEEVIR